MLALSSSYCCKHETRLQAPEIISFFLGFVCVLVYFLSQSKQIESQVYWHYSGVVVVAIVVVDSYISSSSKSTSSS